MTISNNNYSLLIREEQIKGILEQSLTNVFGNTIVAILSFWIFYDLLSDTKMLQKGWLGIVLTISIIQFFGILRYKKKGLSKEREKTLLKESIFIALVLGVEPVNNSV